MEDPTGDHPPRLPLSGQLIVSYWSEQGQERIHLLKDVVASLTWRRWEKVLDSGWSDWDLQVYCQAGTVLRVCTVQEEHGSGKRLIRARFQLRPRTSTQLAVAAALTAASGLAYADTILGVAAVGAVLAVSLLAWWLGAVRGAHLLGVFNQTARSMGLLAVERASCPPNHRQTRCVLDEGKER
jgi:hypothetical protein